MSANASDWSDSWIQNNAGYSNGSALYIRLAASKMNDAPRNAKPIGRPNRYPKPENLYDLKKEREIISDSDTETAVMTMATAVATPGLTRTNGLSTFGSSGATLLFRFRAK